MGAGPVFALQIEANTKGDMDDSVNGIADIRRLLNRLKENGIIEYFEDKFNKDKTNELSGTLTYNNSEFSVIYEPNAGDEYTANDSDDALVIGHYVNYDCPLDGIPDICNKLLALRDKIKKLEPERKIQDYACSYTI